MIRIEDTNEILLLNKALLAAKFSGQPENDKLAGDPSLAGLSNRVYDNTDKLQKNPLLDEKALAELRRIKTPRGYRGQWRTAVMSARRDRMLAEATPEERISLAKCYLSPFTCKEGELRDFLDQVDGKTGCHDLEKLVSECDLVLAKLLDVSYSFSGRQAHTVFILKDTRVLDIYFSSVSEFVLERGKSSGSENEMPEVKKISVSKSKQATFEAELSGDSGKITLKICAESVDYWL